MLALLAVLVPLLWWVVYKLRHRYIGYGWEFDWKDGEVFVLTRLLDSPSGRAKVRFGARILEYNGKPLEFKSQEELRAFTPILRAKKIGQKAVVKIREGDTERTVTMRAEVIWGPIPYYGSWSSEYMDRMQTEGHFVPDYCKRTGEHYFRFFRNRD